jgi:hypothetical protein
MKFILVFVFALSGITASLAQPETAHWSGMNYLAGESYFTYGDQITLRELPSVASKKIGSIPVLTEITILEISETLINIYGIENPWIKISYKGTQGYIASGFLALRSIELKDGSTLLYTRVKEHHIEHAQSLAFRQVYDDVTVELGSYPLGHRNFNILVSNGRGLTGVDQIITIDFLAEACGEEGGRSYLLLLEDSSVNYLGVFSSVGDGGVYHASEDLTFPFDSGGKHDCIIFNGEEGEEDENGLYKTVSFSKVYGWSADGLSEPIVIPSYR